MCVGSGHKKRSRPTVRGARLSALLSIVIPTLNAADTLPATLDFIAATGDGLVGEVIVADGGSTDGTDALAEAGGATVVRAARGRGAQLAAGARAASGAWLLFMHADTVLEPGWRAAVVDFIAEPASGGLAATFRFALDDPSPAARRLEAIVSWRCRFLALPYGDQGLLIGAGLYRSLGGFRPLPLMEDVDMVRRIGRGRLVMLDLGAVTSAARYRRAGYLGRAVRNVGCLTLYFLGVPTRLIVRLYG